MTNYRKIISKDSAVIINHPEDKFETLLFLPPTESRKGEGGLRTKGYFKHNYKLNPEDNLWYICDTAGDLVKPAPEEIQREIVDFIASMKSSEPEMANISDITELPLITVITVVLNGEKYLEETIQSVLNQTYDNVEYIIIDGGSTDGTLDIIKQYEHAIDYWVSEKDRGIYDAMNKGIDVASGEWINFMNAGDGFYDNEILSIVHKHIDDIHGVIYGDTLVLYNKFQRIYKALPLEDINYGMVFSHQSSFVRTELYKAKNFSLNYRFAADYDFFYFLYKKKYNFFYIPKILSYMRSAGVSDVNRLAVIAEYESIAKQYTITLKNKLVFLLKKLDQMLRIIMKKLLPDIITEFIIKNK